MAIRVAGNSKTARQLHAENVQRLRSVWLARWLLVTVSVRDKLPTLSASQLASMTGGHRAGVVFNHAEAKAFGTTTPAGAEHWFGGDWVRRMSSGLEVPR